MRCHYLLNCKPVSSPSIHVWRTAPSVATLSGCALLCEHESGQNCMFKRWVHLAAPSRGCERLQQVRGCIRRRTIACWMMQLQAASSLFHLAVFCRIMRKNVHANTNQTEHTHTRAYRNAKYSLQRRRYWRPCWLSCTMHQLHPTTVCPHAAQAWLNFDCRHAHKSTTSRPCPA